MLRVGMNELEEGPHASRVPKLPMHPTRPDPWKVALTCWNSIPSRMDVLRLVDSLKRVNMKERRPPPGQWTLTTSRTCMTWNHFLEKLQFFTCKLWILLSNNCVVVSETYECFVSYLCFELSGLRIDWPCMKTSTLQSLHLVKSSCWQLRIVYLNNYKNV